jgi:predicted branched-subunit amino acid permease
LDFAMSATFIGIVVPYLKNRPMITAAIVASGLGLALHGLPNKLGLMIAALAGVATGFFLEQRLASNRMNEVGEAQ